jgi:hypothetical protein
VSSSRDLPTQPIAGDSPIPEATKTNKPSAVTSTLHPSSRSRNPRPRTLPTFTRVATTSGDSEPSPVPPTLGLTWACKSGCDIDQFCKWDPGGYVTGVTDEGVIGVGAAMWGETVVTFSDVDYMVFPRVSVLAELGWSPKG